MAEVPFLYISSSLSLDDDIAQRRLFFSAESSTGILTDNEAAIRAIGQVADHACGYDCQEKVQFSKTDEQKIFSTGLLVTDESLQEVAARNSVINLANHYSRAGFHSREKGPDGKYARSHHELVLVGTEVIKYAVGRFGALSGFPGYCGQHLSELSNEVFKEGFGVDLLPQSVHETEAESSPQGWVYRLRSALHPVRHRQS